MHRLTGIYLGADNASRNQWILRVARTNLRGTQETRAPNGAFGRRFGGEQARKSKPFARELARVRFQRGGRTILFRSLFANRGPQLRHLHATFLRGGSIYLLFYHERAQNVPGETIVRVQVVYLARNKPPAQVA